MSGHIEERRLRGIAKQIGLLKSEIRSANRRSIMLFFLGLTIGLLANALAKLMGF